MPGSWWGWEGACDTEMKTEWEAKGLGRGIGASSLPTDPQGVGFDDLENSSSCVVADLTSAKVLCPTTQATTKP